MRICSITNNQQEILLKIIAKKLIDLKSKDQAFDLRKYMESLYGYLSPKIIEKDMLIGYMALSPTLLYQLVTHKEYESILGPASAEIFDLKKSFAASPSKVYEYFNLSLSPHQIISEELKNNEIIKKQQALEEARMKELFELSVAYKFSARPDSLHSTTLGDDPDVTTAGNSFVVSVLNDYVSRFGDYGIDEISNKYALVLVNAKDYLRQQDTVDDTLRSGAVFMVSDPQGNILYFDHKKLIYDKVIEQVSEKEGSPVVFRPRRSVNKIQSAEEIAKHSGITTVEANRIIQAQLKEVNQKIDYVLNNTDSKILHRIKWGSTGTVIRNGQNRKQLKNSNLDPDTFRVVAVFKQEDGKNKKPTIHLQTSHFDEVIPIRGNYINSASQPNLNISPELRNALLKVLLGNDITIEGAKLDPMNPSVIKYRARFINTYLGNNYNIAIDEKTGELHITKKEDGKSISYKKTKYDPKTGQYVFVGEGYNINNLLSDISTYTTKDGKEADQVINILVDTETTKPLGFNTNSKGEINLKEITNREYKVSLINNSNTEVQFNDETGNFDRMHPYFKFTVASEELGKFTDDNTASVLDLESPDIEVIYGEGITDESLEDIEFPDVESFDKMLEQKMVSATPEQIKRAYDWWKSHPMSSKIPFKAVFELFNANNRNSVATFNKYGITLYKGSDYSDLYHEAFHAFTQIFLTQEQRGELYNSVRNLKGSTTDYTGARVNFSDMTDKQAEEYLAEKFREYMLSGGKKFGENTPTKAKSIFKLLLDILKDIFGFGSMDIENVLDNYQANAVINDAFFNLRVGNILDAKADLTGAEEFNKLKAVSKDQEENVDKLSYSDLKLLVDTINSMMSSIINTKDADGTDIRYSSIVNNANKRVDLYNQVLAKLIKKAKDIREEYDAIEDTNDPNKKKLLKLFNILAIGIKNYSPSIATEKKVTLNDVLVGSAAESSGLVAYHIAKSKDFLIVDDTYNIEEASKSGKDYVKNSGNDLSAKDLAAADIHFLVNSILQTKANALGEPQLEDPIYVWNLLTRIGKGVKNADEFYEKMKTFLNKIGSNTRNYNVINQIISKLGNPKISMTDGKFEDYIPQQNLWTSVVNIFTLPRIKLVQLNVSTSVDDTTGKRSVAILPGVSKSETDPIRRAYDNIFSTSKSAYIKRHKNKGLGPVDSQSGYHLDLLKVYSENPSVADAAAKLKFLRAIGIDITANADMLNNIASRPRTLGAFASMMHNKVKELLQYNNTLKENNQPLIYITKPSQLVELNIPNTEHIRNHSTLYRTLLETELETSGKYTTGMVSNASGDPQYEVSLKSTISEKIRMFNDAKSYSELIAIPEMSYLDVRRNPFIKSLRIMTETFGNDFWKPGKGAREAKSLTVSGTERSTQIELLNSSGVAIIENDLNQYGISSHEADDTTQILQNLFTYMLYGVSEATRHSDKSTTLYYRTPLKGQYVSFNSFFEDKAIRNQKIVKIMQGYLYSEVSRIVRLKNDDPSGNATVGDSTYKEVGSQITNFEGILNSETRASIQKWVENYKITDDNVDNIEDDFRSQWMSQNYADVSVQIINYFENIIAESIADITSTGILDKSNPRAIELWNNIKSIRGYDTTNPEFDDNIIAAYTVNSWMHAYESTIMFYGDPALYNHLKEEFHKRNPFIAATGTIPRVDASFIDFVSFYRREDRYASSKYFKGTLSERAKNKMWGQTMDSAVFQDTSYTSLNYDTYLKIAIEKEKARYAKANKEFTKEDEKRIVEDFKEYKNMKIGDGQGWITFDSYRDLMLSLRRWSPQQEKLYWDIISGKDPGVLTVNQFFPVIKMQYSGELATTKGLPVQGYHKFSLMPLIPNVIEGTSLETLHNRMTEQGLDYGTFHSGSKINTLTKDGTPDKFYTDNKVLTDVAFEDPDYEFTINPIFTQFFKQQIESSDVFKNKIVFSTQLRKIVEEGLYEEGRPRSFNGTKQQFDALSEIEKSKYIEYQKITKYENLIVALTRKKYEELEKDADLKFEDGKFVLSQKLVDYLNKQLTVQDVAEHEIDFIKYDARTNKLTFDLSIHPSAGMIDKLVSALIYKKIVNQKVNGEALVQVSGAGLGLRKATEEENKLYDNDSLPFYKYTPEGTLAMKVKIAIQGDYKKLLKHPDVLELVEKSKGALSDLNALNKLIKDEKWMQKNRKLVTMGGVRIPVSGLNMIEVAEIYEFLPENAGNMIILPAEIVAKSGSDFDIDKLSMMFPNLKIIGKKVKLLTYDASAERRLAGNKALLKELYDHLDNLFVKLDEFDIDKKQEDLYKVILEYKSKKEAIKDQIWGEFATVNADGLESLHEELHEIKWVLTNLYAKSKKLSAQVAKMFTDEINPTFEKIDSVIEDIASASSKAIENDLMFMVADIALMPENFVDFISANGTSTLQPMAEKLSKFGQYDKYRNGNNETFYNPIKPEKKRITATKIFELGFNRYKHTSNNIGMRSLGIAAVSNTYNTVLSRVGAYMESSVVLGARKDKKNSGYAVYQTFRGGLEFNKTATGQISLSKLYDATNTYKISKLIGEVINGTVDVAKDSWIFDIQGNTEIVPILLFMFQAGVPPQQAVDFLSQPIIKKYVERQRAIKSAFAKPLGVQSANTNMFRVQARRDILSENPALDKHVQETGADPALFKAVNFTNRKLKRTVYDYLVPTLLNGSENFTDEALVNQLNNPSDLEQLQIFIHFIEIEEMSKAITEIQQGLNFDTSKLSSMFEIRTKIANINNLNKEKRLNSTVVDDIINNSPIGSFIKYIDFDNVFQGLFPTRTDQHIYEALKVSFPFLTDDILQTYGGKFKDYAALANRFIDDFTNYIYQQANLATLKNFDPLQIFKGFDVDGSRTSVPVERALLLLRGGVFVKDGVLHVDINTLRSDFKNRAYANITSRNGTPGVAPVSSDYFNDSEDNLINFHKYVKFVYNRETLRSMIPFASYLESEDHRARYEISQIPDEDTNKSFMIYEEFLRDMAMFQSGNADFMFKDYNGFAKQIEFISAKYPNLQKIYTVLSSLYARKQAGVINLRLEELILDADTINIYHEQITNLANPNIKKVENKVDNIIISNLFQRFAMFAFLQTGLDGKGQLSLGRIVPTNVIAQMQDASLKWYHDKVKNSKFLDDFISKYVELFNNMYKVSEEDENGEVINVSTGLRPIMKNYGSFYFTSPGSQFFITPTPYRSDIKIYNIRSVNKNQFIEKVKSTIKQYKDAGKTAVFVINDTRPTDNKSAAYRSEQKFNATVLKNLVEEGIIDAKHVFSLSTKKGDRWALVNEDFFSDSTYKQNTDLIEKQLQDLKALAADPNVQVIFNSEGVGLPLLGYGRSETPIEANMVSPYTGTVRKISEEANEFSAPAPKTYVYLSKRIYELFGYVNPKLVTIGKAIEGAADLRKEILGKEKITNAEVEEVIKNCLINTLG